ncbi:MAG: hypothetical protein KAJ29_02615 [Alphaproteobacteria bacterium]|nr:hypothetical protein [Alphaproteobacteria bacterium]
MKLTILKYGALLTFLILSATMLMHVSQNVQQLERDIMRDDRWIEQEKEKIRVLKAEWAYLNDPQRLEAIASGGYDMQIPKTNTLVSDPARLPNIFTSDQEALSSITPSSGETSQDKLQDKLNLLPKEQGEQE